MSRVVDAKDQHRNRQALLERDAQKRRERDQEAEEREKRLSRWLDEQ